MKMKDILALAALLLFSAGLGAQNDQAVRPYEGDVVVVRVIERPALSTWQSRIVISDGGGESQTIALKRLGNNSNMENNVAVIAKVFNEISRQGYLLSVPPGYNQSEGSTLYVDYIFTKGNKRE